MVQSTLHASATTHECGKCRDIHDRVSHAEEVFAIERFGEEVGEIVNRPYEGDGDLMIFNTLAHVEMTTLYVLDLLVMLRVVRRVPGGSVVDAERHRLSVVQLELGQETLEVNGLGGGHGSRHEFRFARRERDAGLFL